MKKSNFVLSILLALTLFALPASAKRITAAYTLLQSDSGASLTNTSSGPITIAIPHGLTLPYSVQINGGKGGVNLGVLTADLLSADGYIDPGTSAILTIIGNNTNNTIAISTPTAPLPTATTGAISGVLAAGACETGTAAVAGSTTAMVAIASPVTYPGDGAVWHAYVSTAGTVTVVLCSIAGQTPTSSTYNVRVIR